MAQIVTVKNGQTDEIEYPRTVKSALLNDDGTFLNPLTPTNIINDLTTGGETNVLSAQQGVELSSAIGQNASDLNAHKADYVQYKENTTSQLAEKAIHISNFPVQVPEVDDTARFQRALNSTYNLFLEKGKTYTVNNLIINRIGFSLFGNRSKLETSNPTASSIIIQHTSKDILIDGLDFQGVADGTNDTPAGIGIQSSGVSASRGTSAINIEISNCNFLGGFVFSIIANSTTGLKIHGCYGTGNKYVSSVSAGGYFILTQSCYDVEIFNNKAVATTTDRHAIYISCDNSLTGDKANEDVYIHHNTFDWSLANAGTESEAVIVVRTTRGIHIHDNKTKGGWGGILVNPSHGDCVNVDIHDNQVSNVLSSATKELVGIGTVPQDKGGSYKVRNIKIHNNQVSTSGNRVFGYALYDTIGFELQNNSASVQGSGSRGCQIAQCSEGIISGNRLDGQGTGRVGFGFGATLDKITVGINYLTNFILRKEEIYNGASITNMIHPYKRGATISSNGTGTITVSGDIDNIVDSVVTDANGCVITFKKNVMVRHGLVDVIPLDGSFNRYFYNRAIDVINNTLTLGIKSNDAVTPYSLSTIISNFDILIYE